ncbi:MAG: hypothetical protein ACTHJG_02085 [Rhodanobacteraceae bacterium]
MMITRAHPLAMFLGLPGRLTRRLPQEKKTKTAAPAAKVKTMKHNKHAREIERRVLANMDREDSAQHTSFLHLLRDSRRDNRAKVSKPVKPIASAPVPPSESKPPPTAAARKMIALSAELSGETMQEADIQVRMRQDQDRAIGFTPEVRAIVDRAQKNKRRTQ